jgi:hypothetical protein
MIEAAEMATQFVAGRDRRDLDSDPMLLFALRERFILDPYDHLDQ